MKFVTAINTIHDNVWALVIITGGVGLMLRGHSTEGAMLVTLGAAVFQKKSADQPA
jgi:hypothetical protein